jgi:hypothetical protein
MLLSLELLRPTKRPGGAMSRRILRAHAQAIIETCAGSNRSIPRLDMVSSTHVHTTPAANANWGWIQNLQPLERD